MPSRMSFTPTISKAGREFSQLAIYCLIDWRPKRKSRMKSFYAIVILAAPCCLAQNYPPLTVYAGTPLDSAFSGDGGQATNATFANPWNVAVDTKDNLYIADECNNRVRKVDTTGIITTVAGSGNSMGICNMATGYSGDGGSATAAQLNGPTGVAVDS